MLVKAGPRYAEFLAVYEAKTGKHPTFVERIEAFFASINGTIPNWMYWYMLPDTSWFKGQPKMVR